MSGKICALIVVCGVAVGCQRGEGEGVPMSSPDAGRATTAAQSEYKQTAAHDYSISNASTNQPVLAGAPAAGAGSRAASAKPVGMAAAGGGMMGLSKLAMAPAVERFAHDHSSAAAVDVEHSTEAYDHVVDNAFLGVGRNPLSTFSIDVDTASYSNMRRFLSQGQLPPRGAVRIEELVNYFTYDYPQPQKDVPFSASIEVATCPWNPAHRLARVGLKGQGFQGVIQCGEVQGFWRSRHDLRCDICCVASAVFSGRVCIYGSG